RTSSAFWSPTCNSLTLAWPMDPNSVNAGRGMLSSTPDALAILVFSSVIGAPVSKISRYGPLPLTLTMTVMCPVVSNSKGTRTALSGAGPRADREPAAARSRAPTSRWRFISEALPGLETDVLILAVPHHRQLDAHAGAEPAREAVHVVGVHHGPALE